MTDRPQRADARRNRDKVLQAAAEAFADAGFAVPLDDIARRAGVGPGTIYRHFATKEALFEAVNTARVDALVEKAQTLAGAADAGAAFFGFLDRLADEATARRDLTEAIAVPGELQRDLHTAFERLLRRAQEAGAVRTDITFPELLALFKGVLAGINGGEVPPNTLLTVLRDGLRPPRRVT